MRPALTSASRLVLDLPIPEEWKAELTLSNPAMRRPVVELAIFRSQCPTPHNHFYTPPVNLGGLL